MANNQLVLSTDKIKSKIHTLRNVQVMLDVDLAAVKGTGIGGIITEEDIKNSVQVKKQASAPKSAFKKTKKYDFYGYVDHVPLKGIRKISKTERRTYRKSAGNMRSL